MAENLATTTGETGAEMDYAEHERTFAGFVGLTKLSIAVSINVMISLVLYGFGTAGTSFLLGTLVLIALIIAAAIGLAMNYSWKPSAFVAVIGIILVILTVA